MQSLFGMMVTKSISAVAELGVADALKGGPLYYTDLAEAVGADQRALHRVMRMLGGVGIFAEPQPGTFALTPVSDLLRSDAPGSLRGVAVLLTARSHWEPWGRLGDVLRTGESGAWHAFGTDAFTWFQAAENKTEWEIFNAAMTSLSLGTARAVVESVDFSQFESIVDVGGGHGHLLNTILAAAPDAGRRLRPTGRRRQCPPIGPHSVRGGRFLHGGACRRRLLRNEAHPPRLERRAVCHDPVEHRPGADRKRPSVRGGNCDAREP